MADQDLLYEKKDGIAIITLNRPHRMNALPIDIWTDGLAELWKDFDSDPKMRVAVLTATGDRAFCTGVDVKDTAQRDREGRQRSAGEIRATPWQNQVSKPVITAVNGLCGGGGLMLVSDSDIAIASPNAQFFNPGVGVGIVALYGQAVWTKWVPFQSVMRMALMGPGERISAHRACELGIITEVVEDKPLLERAVELAGIMGRNSPAAMRIAKKALWAAVEASGVNGALEAVNQVTKAYAGHPDQTEGPRAFAEKRRPNWQEP